MFSGLLPKKTTQAEEDLMPFAVWSQPCVTSLCRGSILRKHLPPRARRYTKETLETQCFRYTSCPDRYATRKTSWRSHPPLAIDPQGVGHPQPGWEEAFPVHHPAVKTIGKTLYLRVKEVPYSKMRDQDLTY